MENRSCELTTTRRRLQGADSREFMMFMAALAEVKHTQFVQVMTGLAEDAGAAVTPADCGLQTEHLLL